MMHKIIIVEQEDEWNDYVNRSINYDCFHSWFYHTLDNSGKPFLFVYQEDDIFIALPLLKRKIDDSSLFDLSSVYGYSGPISNRPFEEIDDHLLLDFTDLFVNFMKSEDCICVFLRLHPFYRQDILLNKIGGVAANGKTVYMDLTISVDEQRSRYEKRLFRQIKQLRKQDFVIRDTRDAKHIKAFTEMYSENMDRVSASQSYYYSEEYFSELIHNKDFNCKLIMVFDGETAICGAIVMYANNIIRTHLSATAANYLKESPSKLLTDEISLIGRQMGAKYFHLGGGVGGREDTLYKFKSYFSGLYLHDYTWRFIADNDAYNAQVEIRGMRRMAQPDFFPQYRSVQLVALKD